MNLMKRQHPKEYTEDYTIRIRDVLLSFVMAFLAYIVLAVGFKLLAGEGLWCLF